MCVFFGGVGLKCQFHFHGRGDFSDIGFQIAGLAAHFPFLAEGRGEI